jgi:hypothetical protein
MALAFDLFVEVAITTQDAQGEKAVTLYRYLLPGGATVGDLQTLATDVATAQAGLMDGAITNVKVSTNGWQLASAGGSLYQSVDDGARFKFQSTQQDFMNKRVPTPLSTIFLPDQEQVDPANAAVVAWQGTVKLDVIGSANWIGCDEDGVTISNAVYGRREWRRRKSGGKPV